MDEYDWFTLDIFGRRAVPSLPGRPLRKKAVRQLADHLKQCAGSIGICVGLNHVTYQAYHRSKYGKSKVNCELRERIYTGVVKRLVKKRHLSKASAGQTPVAKCIKFLEKAIEKRRRKTRQLCSGTVQGPDWLKMVAIQIDELVASPESMDRFQQVIREWAAALMESKQSVFPMPPDRALTSQEKYVALARIHDDVCDGTKRIDPWATVEDGDTEAMKAGIPYSVLDIRGIHDTPGHHELVEGWLADVRRDLETRLSKAAQPVTTPLASANKTWQEVLESLLEMRNRGEPYTTQKELATRLVCSPPLVNKAIHKSDVLKDWMAQARESEPKAAPKATSINEVIEDQLPQSREPQPDEALGKDEVDVVMAKLIDQAKPEERATLNALNADGRRRMAILCNQQHKDFASEPSPLEPDPPDKQARKVIHHKRA